MVLYTKTPFLSTPGVGGTKGYDPVASTALSYLISCDSSCVVEHGAGVVSQENERKSGDLASAID